MDLAADPVPLIFPLVPSSRQLRGRHSSLEVFLDVDSSRGAIVEQHVAPRKGWYPAPAGCSRFVKMAVTGHLATVREKANSPDRFPRLKADSPDPIGQERPESPSRM